MGYKVFNEFDLSSTPPPKKHIDTAFSDDDIIHIYKSFARTYAEALQEYVNNGGKDMLKLATEVLELCEFVAILKAELERNPNFFKELGDDLMQLFEKEQNG